MRAPGFLELLFPAVQIRRNDITSLNVELEATPNFMEQVQITATKGSLSVGDVAAQADVLDKTTFDLRGETTVPQAVAHLPGAVVSTQLGIFESITLRGMPGETDSEP